MNFSKQNAFHILPQIIALALSLFIHTICYAKYDGKPKLVLEKSRYTADDLVRFWVGVVVSIFVGERSAPNAWVSPLLIPVEGKREISPDAR